MPKIKQYTSNVNVSLPSGTGYSPAAVKASSGSAADYGTSITKIGNMLIEAGMQRSTNQSAGTNIQILTSKINDTEYMRNFQRDMINASEEVLINGGDAFAATKILRDKYGLDFGNKANAGDILNKTINGFDARHKQFNTDRVGFILDTVPGAKELMDGLQPGTQAYHENLKIIAEGAGIHLEHGFGKAFIEEQAKNYSELPAAGKVAYLSQMQNDLGDDVFGDLLYALSTVEGGPSGVDQIGYGASTEAHRNLWFNATASDKDITDFDTQDKIGTAAQNITLKYQRLYFPEENPPTDAFHTKMKQLIYRLMQDGHNVADAQNIIETEFFEKGKIIRGVSNAGGFFESSGNHMKMLAMADRDFLNNKFGKGADAKVEAFMDEFSDHPYMREFIAKEIYEGGNLLTDQFRQQLYEMNRNTMAPESGEISDKLEAEINAATDRDLREYTIGQLVDNMRLVNTRDGREGFAVQMNELYIHKNIIGKDGGEVMITYDRIISSNNISHEASRYTTQRYIDSKNK